MNAYQKTTISGGEALIKSLLRQEVTTMFGYPGGAIMPVYDELYHYNDKLNHILVRHEQGAVHAAQGYARVSGRVGVCMVTSGPGATNTITGIADAMVDSTPLVIIAGQVPTGLLGTDGFQEVDLVGVTQPITKWSYQIRSAEDVAWAVARAFYIARTGRPGPVVLDFTKNAQIDKINYKPVTIDFIRSYQPYPQIDTNQIKRAATLINAAKRPFMLVGQGVEISQANQALIQVIEKADIPFASTLLGLSAVASTHPLNKGMLGMHGNLSPNIKTNEADVIIAVGMRFDDRVTGNLSKYATQAKIIHLDIDAAELGKNVPVAVPVLGDCKESLQQLLPLLEATNHEEWKQSFSHYDEKENKVVIQKEIAPEQGPITMGEVVYNVSVLSNQDAIIVTDVGQNQMMAARYSRYKTTRSFVTSGGMGTMGFGLPAAIGATFGAPKRTVCAFMGDGGMQMSIQELGTIMEQKAPVKMIILNNNYLGNVRQWQAMFFERKYSFTPMANPHYCTIAKAYNIPSKWVGQRDELAAAIQEMLSTEGPYLLEVAVIQEGNVVPMVSPGKAINEMQLEV
jgi:acetolactate synthase-1/2/3 large subunit